ncbi:hypothetical protein [Periweissella ghanensis]|uniref:hypothetical protein n=1 Tax=Periweissella ghanensis TaxID=467997 RepID=UPI001E405611|nr:hypothetical protein [Periweissella ghanensis]MCM0601234.1 hypothetical protein [Periweissella ghanensis]
MTNDKNKKANKRQKPMTERACRACGKPFKHRSRACLSCKKLAKEIQEIEHYEYPISTAKLHWVMVYTQSSDHDVIKQWFKEHHDHWKYTSTARELTREDNKRKRENKIPDTISSEELHRDFSYLFELFKSNAYYAKYKLISIRGTYQEPLSIITCNACGQELMINVAEVSSIGVVRHRCPEHVSLGERIINEYLTSKGINFKTQFDTLKCINPKANYPLPYDFELIDSKTIIEVQGDQHYRFIPVFHRNELGFEYQKYKDRYKKKFAIDRGYKYIEIDYKELKDNSFVQKLS